MLLLYLFKQWTFYIDIEYVYWANPEKRLHIEITTQFIDNLLVYMHTNATIVKVEISVLYIFLADKWILQYCRIRSWNTFASVLDFDLELCLKIMEFFINFLNKFSKNFNRFTVRFRAFYSALKKIHEHILEKLLI